MPKWDCRYPLNENRFFAVTAKCGHVSKQYYVPVTFAIAAGSAAEAADKASILPRVKKHHKDRILSVMEISRAEFRELKKSNNEDPYLRCSSQQEQAARVLNLESRVIEENRYQDSFSKIRKHPHERKPTAFFFGKEPIKTNPLAFSRHVPGAFFFSSVI